MRIGVDIDDTTSKTDERLVKEAYYYDKKYLKGRGFQDKNAYSFTEMLFWNVIDVDNFLHYIRNSKFFLKLDEMEGASKYINKLKEDGHEIIFITKRVKKMKSIMYTKKWLKSKGINYDKLIMGSSDKASVVDAEDIDLLIDDDIKNIKKVRELGKKAFLMTSKYNLKEKYADRVDSWEEIYKKIKEV